MKPVLFWVALLATACAERPDPRLQAAEDFRTSVFDVINQDETQMRRLGALRLGMSDSEVLSAVGPPSRRESHATEGGVGRELWTYNGAFKALGMLTFENQRLVEIQVQ